jgi:hypothetical protein
MKWPTDLISRNKTLIKKSFLWLLILIFALAIYSPYFLGGWKDREPAHMDNWNFFHYYLGAKYFNELGYFDFYQCAISAGKELKVAGWNDETIVRNLKNYDLTESRHLPPCPKEKFSAERWEEYKKDITLILNYKAGPSAVGILDLVTDKGFNPLPFWTVLAGAVANFFPNTGPAFAFLMNLDFIVLIISIIFIWKSAGEPMARITATITLFYFGTFSSLGGQFLQYFWFLGLVWAIIAWRKDKPAVSGLLMGITTAIRSFPLFFALPIFIVTLFSIIRRKVEVKAFQFSLAFLIALTLCVGVGSLSDRGFGAWIEWQEKIGIHAKYLRGEIFNIGLPTFLSTVLSPVKDTTTNYLQNFPNTINPPTKYPFFLL